MNVGFHFKSSKQLETLNDLIIQPNYVIWIFKK